MVVSMLILARSTSSATCRASSAWLFMSSPCLDVAAPRAGLATPRFDELLEPLGVLLDLHFVHVDGRADLLGHAGGLPVDLDHHPGGRVAEAVECDHAGMLGIATDAAPGDPFVRVLLGDLGVELPLYARDVGDPVVARVVDLGDRLNAGHEVRERLELGPLVVGDAHWYLDVDGLLDLAHRELLRSKQHVAAWYPRRVTLNRMRR